MNAALAEQLGEKPFLIGDRMTIADPYLFVMLMWTARHGIEVPERFETCSAHMKAIPSVLHALAEERLA
jgi:glutathione S-transferase